MTDVITAQRNYEALKKQDEKLPFFSRFLAACGAGISFSGIMMGWQMVFHNGVGGGSWFLGGCIGLVGIIGLLVWGKAALFGK